MKITKIEAWQIETPRFGTIVSGHIILKVHTDGDVVGIGEVSDSRAGDLANVVRQYNELLVGRDPACITEINTMLREHDFGDEVGSPHLASGIDLGLYDLNGKAQGVPAYQLMGGKVRDRIYCCYPIFGNWVRRDYDYGAKSLQHLADQGHHLFRYYISNDVELDNRFLTEMKDRFGDQIRLKSLDLKGYFKDWEEALRYADVIRHHAPYHFEQPSRDLRECAEFTKRVDLHVSQHIGSLSHGYEAIERGACTAFNLACVIGGPTYIRRIFAMAEGAGIRCLVGTDQESTLGTSAQVQVGVSVPNLDLPCDPMGPVLYTTSPAKERVRAEESYLYPPGEPGLGVELDEVKLKELTVAQA
ncbi:MAG: enolase C-terminal domain-like protein [Candidatus Latescibacteria bacterium]|jgi:muconate cycloisomerase|nr:enolase C-terminal domain-like protein [Candidatus Latescibacterota bacterium]